VFDIDSIRDQVHGPGGASPTLQLGAAHDDLVCARHQLFFAPLPTPAFAFGHVGVEPVVGDVVHRAKSAAPDEPGVRAVVHPEDGTVEARSRHRRAHLPDE